MDPSARTRIWDLPTRLFHWLLAALVIFSFTTGKLGGDWLTWHFRSGYAIASLLLFRLLWGFAGSRYARFASFLPSPSRVWRTVRLAEPRAVPVSAGHSEIGTLSVYALLIVLALQVATGVFTNDGSFTEGPWVKFVSEALSNRLSRIHYYNHWLIVGTDSAARGCDRVLLARTQGRLADTDADRRQARHRRPGSGRRHVTPVRAAVLAAAAAVVVYFLVA